MEVEAGCSSHTQSCSLQRVHHRENPHAEVVSQLLVSIAVDTLDEKRLGRIVELQTVYFGLMCSAQNR